MANDTKQELAKNALRVAQQKGASDAAIVVREKREVDLTWRDGRLEKITESTSRGLDLRLYVDGRYSACSTNDLREEGLAAFIENAVALTRTLTKDPLRTLPDPKLYQGQTKADLELSDPKVDSVTPLDLRRALEATEQAARGTPGAESILSVTSNGGFAAEEMLRLHSNGFQGSFRNTTFWSSATVTIKDADGRRPEEDHYAVARFFSDLPDAASIGRRAAERALARRGAKKISSGQMPILIQNRSSGRLLGYLLRALSGASLQQKRSFLDGLVGKPFGNENLDIKDDPWLIRGLGSRPFDNEGIASRPMPLFEKGVLKSHYIDTYYGKKIKMAETTGSMSNLVWTLGTKGEAALIAGIDKGLLITSFIGGNSNDTTGDFSVGAQGFAIRGGKLEEPIAEANVSGKHLDFWKRLVAVGDDPFLSSPTRTPTLVFDGVSVAGT